MVQPLAIRELLANEELEVYVSVPVGQSELTVYLEPQQLLRQADYNNDDSTVPIEAWRTRTIQVPYVVIEGPERSPCLPLLGGYSHVNRAIADENMRKGHSFLRATYPVAFPASDVFPSVAGEIAGSCVPLTGMADDMLKAWQSAERAFPYTDKVVAIVPIDYFSFHFPWLPPGQAPVGLAFGWGSVGLVNEHYPSAIAHELGHTFGLHVGAEEYTDSAVGACAAGFGVDRQTEIDDGVCFMGRSLSSRFDFREPNTCEATYRQTCDAESPCTWDLWVDDDDYEQLFRTLVVQPGAIANAEPEILLISGTAQDNGVVEWRPWYRSARGRVSDDNVGEWSIVFHDITGNVVLERAFDVPMHAILEKVGPVDIGGGLITLAIEYPSTAVGCLVLRRGELMDSIDIGTKLIHDALDLVPDAAFINNSSERRKALHNKISALEHQIADADIEDAIEKLEEDIGPKFQSWLVDGYEVETPLQLSKQEVLDLASALIRRLEAQGILLEDDADEDGDDDEDEAGEEEDDDADDSSAKGSLDAVAQDRGSGVGCGAFSPGILLPVLAGLCLMRLSGGRWSAKRQHR